MSEISTYRFRPNLKKRILATLFDYGLIVLFTYAYIMCCGHDNENGGKRVDGLPALLIPIVWFLYFVCIETFNHGTLGHTAMGLRVVLSDRKPINFSNSLKRHLLDPIDFFLWGIPALIAIKKTEKHQRLGDLWADTIVIDTADPDQCLQTV